MTFPKMIVLMARKSVKSLQNILNETEVYLSNILNEDLVTVSKGAYTQAIEKIKHTAFIELCEDIRDKFYQEYDYTKYKGFRLLAVDGSMVTLPNNDETQKAFDTINVVNQYKDRATCKSNSKNRPSPKRISQSANNLINREKISNLE